MKRTSKLFRFCTLFNPQRRRRSSVSVCDLALGFLESTFVISGGSAIVSLMFWFFGTVFGELVGMVVTQTLMYGAAYVFIQVIGFVIVIGSAIIGTMILIAGIDVGWRKFKQSASCKTIKIT